MIFSYSYIRSYIFSDFILGEVDIIEVKDEAHTRLCDCGNSPRSRKLTIFFLFESSK